MSRADFEEYAASPAAANGGNGCGGRSQSQQPQPFPSLLDMAMLEGAAEDDPDFCSDVR